MELNQTINTNTTRLRLSLSLTHIISFLCATNNMDMIAGSRFLLDCNAIHCDQARNVLCFLNYFFIVMHFVRLLYCTVLLLFTFLFFSFHDVLLLPY